MNNRVVEKKGSIVCVGIGMTLGSHLSPLSRSYIIEADIVFVLVSDGIVEKWITEMNKSVKSLQVYYHEGSSRGKSYQLMVDDIYSHVQNGEKVVGAFYGHPGVFACVPHMVIELARNNGFYAKMEPGISAEDCLYADVGIDPGEFGCTHFEASQFMFFERKVDNSAYLILWQVAIVGDTSLTQFSTGKQYRELFLSLLAEYYDLDHEVILYEATVLVLL